MASLSDWLRQQRRQRGWSQSHLAQAAGISERTIQRLEQGAACSGETLMALAAALECSTENLIGLATRRAGGRASRSLRWLGPLLDGLLLRHLAPRSRLLLGLAALFPAAYFITANVLFYQLGVPWL